MDSSGLSAHTDYTPYGERITYGPGHARTSLGYHGEMTDGHGMVYMRARTYDPRLSQFLQRDPMLGAHPTLPASWNPYALAHGNPVNLTDPTGACPFCIAGLAAIGIGALGFGGYASYQQYQHHGWDVGAWDYRYIGYMSAVGSGVGLAAFAVAAPLVIYGGPALVSAGSTMLTHYMANPQAYHGVGCFGFEVFTEAEACEAMGIPGPDLPPVRRWARDASDGISAFARRLDLNAVTMGGLPVLRRGTGSWLDAIVAGNRVIDVPTGVNPEVAVQRLQARIRSEVRSKGTIPDTKLVVSILETDGKWHVGINSSWDYAFSKATKTTDLKRVMRQEGLTDRWFNQHAETNAIVQYTLSTKNRGGVGKLFVSHVPCPICVQVDDLTNQRYADLRGDIQLTAQGVFSELELIFPRNPNDAFQANPIILRP